VRGAETNRRNRILRPPRVLEELRFTSGALRESELKVALRHAVGTSLDPDIVGVRVQLRNPRLTKS
jgi:hypothetical protein